MTNRWIVAFIGAAGSLLLGQQPLPGPSELLSQIRTKARANLTGLPDYTCLQTVERTQKDGPQREFTPVDTIRVEVALVGDRELFSWPGAAQFEERSLGDLVGRGVIGNGHFALHARNVFLSAGPRFTFSGETEVDGRPAVQFDFEVPAQRATYHVRVGNKEAAVPFRGSFWADPSTFELIRLQIDADELPESLGLFSVRDVIDYSRIDISGANHLLPVSSVFTMLGIDGIDHRNLTKFSSCRRYSGETKLSFSETPTDEELVKPLEQPVTSAIRVPARLPVELSLDADVNLETVTVGDPLRAILAKPVRSADSVVLPEGTVVLGRVVRLDRQSLPYEHYILGVQFDSLEVDNNRTPFVATMMSAGPASGLIRQEKKLDPTFTKRRSAKMSILVNETREGEGTLHWEARKPIIQRGLRMRWMTGPASPER